MVGGDVQRGARRELLGQALRRAGRRTSAGRARRRSRRRSGGPCRPARCSTCRPATRSPAASCSAARSMRSSPVSRPWNVPPLSATLVSGVCWKVGRGDLGGVHARLVGELEDRGVRLPDASARSTAASGAGSSARRCPDCARCSRAGRARPGGRPVPTEASEVAVVAGKPAVIGRPVPPREVRSSEVQVRGLVRVGLDLLPAEAVDQEHAVPVGRGQLGDRRGECRVRPCPATSVGSRSASEPVPYSGTGAVSRASGSGSSGQARLGHQRAVVRGSPRRAPGRRRGSGGRSPGRRRPR